MNHNANTSLIEASPIEFDFSDHYGETWEVLIDTCDPCGACQGSGFIHDGDGIETNCKLCDGLGCVENESWFPLAKTIKIYPLPPKYKPNDNIKKLLVNCTIVSISGMIYLVPISNQQWDICETYVRLGFFPPACMVLPKQRGRGESNTDKNIVEHLSESINRVMNQLKDRLTLMQMLPAVVAEKKEPVVAAKRYEPVMPAYKKKRSRITQNPLALPIPQWLDDDDD